MLSALRALGARYDLAALQPPDPAGAQPAAAAQHHPAWAPLHAWCLAGSSPLGQTLSVAMLEGADAAKAHALAQALCLELDGSLQLQACRGAAARLALRLKTKLHDVTPGRARQPGDAWDAGFLPGTATGLQALARFQPRRATLLVAAGLDLPALRATCTLLHARFRHRHGGHHAHDARSPRHALRLLVLPVQPGLDIGRPVTRIALAAPALAA